MFLRPELDAMPLSWMSQSRENKKRGYQSDEENSADAIGREMGSPVEQERLEARIRGREQGEQKIRRGRTGN